jgi:hypothetical protein
MRKEIMFNFEPKLDRFKAQCAVVDTGIVWGDWEYLTVEETDALGQVVDFTAVANATNMFHRYTVEQLEPAFESTELDDTHFTTMYNKFIKEES